MIWGRAKARQAANLDAPPACMQLGIEDVQTAAQLGPLPPSKTPHHKVRIGASTSSPTAPLWHTFVNPSPHSWNPPPQSLEFPTPGINWSATPQWGLHHQWAHAGAPSSHS